MVLFLFRLIRPESQDLSFSMIVPYSIKVVPIDSERMDRDWPCTRVRTNHDNSQATDPSPCIEDSPWLSFLSRTWGYDATPAAGPRLQDYNPSRRASSLSLFILVRTRNSDSSSASEDMWLASGTLMSLSCRRLRLTLMWFTPRSFI
jgi:hypothetical protein